MWNVIGLYFGKTGFLYSWKSFSRVANLSILDPIWHRVGYPGLCPITIMFLAVSAAM
jgi:hypothetical protein